MVSCLRWIHASSAYSEPPRAVEAVKEIQMKAANRELNRAFSPDVVALLPSRTTEARFSTGIPCCEEVPELLAIADWLGTTRLKRIAVVSCQKKKTNKQNFSNISPNFSSSHLPFSASPCPIICMNANMRFNYLIKWKGKANLNFDIQTLCMLICP